MSVFFKTGDTPSASELNEPYSQTAAQNIGSDNCARDWSTRKHFDTSGNKINELFFQNGFTGTAYSTTSSTYSTVTKGTRSAVIALNETVPSDTLFRVQWDTLIGDLTLTSDKSPYSNNIYAFRVKVSINGGSVIKYVSAASYSYSARSYATDASALTLSPINWRSCAGVGLLIVDAGDTINNVTLEAATGGGGVNTLVVERFNLAVVEARQ